MYHYVCRGFGRHFEPQTRAAGQERPVVQRLLVLAFKISGGMSMRYMKKPYQECSFNTL